jgi:type III secretion protein V
MAAALRRHAAIFVDRETIKSLRAILQVAFPALAQAVSSLQFRDTDLAVVLRGLLDDGISIRNARRLFELIVEHGSERHDAAWIRERMRCDLAPAFRARYTRGVNTLVAYLVDPALERTAVSPITRVPSDAESDALLTAVRAELRYLPVDAALPVLLTTSEARAAIQQMLAAEHPRVVVLSYDDLPADANIAPIARINVQ